MISRSVFRTKILKPRLDQARKLTAALTLALAALALAAAVPVPAAEDKPQISAEFPYASKFVEVRGARMHYVDEGEGDPFLLLHGNPTSSYLWRNVIPYLKPHGRVIAPDLIGFGKSDKPKIDYTFQDHAAYVDAFIEALGLKNVTLVIHDWGSVIGLDYARRNEANVKGVAFMEAIVPPAFPMKSIADFGPFADVFRAFRDPVKGKEMIIGKNAFIEQFIANATVTRKMTEAELKAYRAPFTDPETRFPIYVWPNELPIEGKPARNVEVVQAVGKWLMTSDKPKLVLYARPGAILPPEAADWMARNYKNIETVFIGAGLHYVQEDQPEAIGRAVADWHRRNFR